MFDSKFVCTLIAIVVTVFAICNFNGNKVTTNEGFLGNGPSMKVRGNLVAQEQTKSGVQFYSVPSFQSNLAPRMMGMAQLGSNIRYNRPSVENMAFNPADPLSMAKMVQENYAAPVKESYCGSSGCGLSCGKGGQSVPHNAGMMMQPNYADGNFNQQVMQAHQQSGQTVNTTGMLPLGDMTTVDAMGQEKQVVMYDNLMYANRRSRLRSQGDMIRGDLPIVPCETGWFRPSVVPSLDLQQGAMNVLVGDGRTQAALNSLIFEDSSRSETTIAGGYDMTNQLGSELVAGQSGVFVTASP